MPDSANGVAMYITDDGRYGPYLNAPASQRLQFRILNHTSENLYFGINPRQRTGSPLSLSTNLYYLIKDSSGAIVAGPFKFNTTAGSAGYIDTYNEAVAGPNIGGAAPTGYTPLSFNPTADGDYYIEIYKSNDSGATRTTSGVDIVLPYFDFTVSDSSNNRTEGRIFSQKWGFITYDPATFVPAIGFDFKGKFFGYTDDKIIVTVEFQEGFRPFGYLLSMNKFGVVDDDNDPSNVWTNTRKSISYNGSTGNSIPDLLNGYPVFITEPDAAAFPIGVEVSPISVGQIFGCPGNYLIPVKTEEAGDVDITLDLNGIIGFQENSKDIIVQAFNQPKGNIVIPWDGIDGEGNPVLGNTTSSATLTSLRGRTSVPMIDAELNPNGLVINSVLPVLANRQMYGDDSGVTVTPNNNTVGGLDKSNPDDGQLGPTHKWNGDNPPGDNTVSMPAAPGTKGSSTSSTTDDFGNERVLNTWFYGEEVASPSNSVTVPDCDIDNDTYSDNADLDDDNDGILDTVELGSFDPDGDHDGDTIPDYIDPQFPGFTDTNSDGVDDRFDLDLDGIMNHWDLDSDGDGIPDSVEAQTTTSYSAPSATVNGDGVPVNFASGIMPINTDEDANPDYLDTDSDGDGLLDTVEAGITLTNLDDDNDGLDNATDATTGPTDVDGNIVPNTLPDDDNDLGIAGGDVDYRDTTDSDYDNDGVPDATDIDDDNDGIIDTEEGSGAACTTVNIPVNGVTNSILQNSSANLINNGSVVADQGMAMNRTTHYAVIDLGATLNSMSTIRFDWWINSSNGSRQQTITQVASSTGSVTGTNPLVVNYPLNETKSDFFIYTLDAPTRYLLVDMTVRTNGRVELTEAKIQLSCPNSLDSDGDGIIDSLDTDSDNDGCPDALEGDGGITLSQIIDFTGGSNGGSIQHLGTTSNASGSPIVNGTAVIQNSTAGVLDANVKSDQCDDDNDGVINLNDVCNGFDDAIDSDNDTIPDSCDDDDDNDGISDAIECPTPIKYRHTLTNDGNLDGNESGTLLDEDSNLLGNWTMAIDLSTGGEFDDAKVAADGNSVYFIYDDDEIGSTFPSPSSSPCPGVSDQYNLTSATFSYTPVNPQSKVNLVMYGSAGSGVGPFGGAFQNNWLNLTVSWIGSGQALVFDPDNQLNISDGSLINSGTTVVNAIAQIPNNDVTWKIVFPSGVNSMTWSETCAQAFEGRRYGIEDFSCPDTDGDTIPDSFDTDSDNDGCPDAVEGAGNIDPSQLTTLTGGSIGGNSNNLGIVSDAEGNPKLNAADTVGFEQNSTEALLDSGDNTACFNDLNIVKTVNKPIVKVGEKIVFSIELTNAGKLNATNINVKDLFPSGLTYDVTSSSIPTNTTYTAVTGIWDLSSITLEPGDSIELKLAATVTTAGTIIMNKTEIFSVTQTDIDSTPNNNN